MSHDYAYPIQLDEQPEGGFLVSAPDFPELLTSGSDRADAVAQGADALEEVFASRIRRAEPIPEPSVSEPGATVEIVRVPPIMAAKAALAVRLRESGTAQSALARRIGVDEKEVRRLLDPRHPSKLGSLQRALRAVDQDLEIRIVEVPNPEIERTDPRSYAEISELAEKSSRAAFAEQVAAGRAIPIQQLLTSARLSETAGEKVELSRDESIHEEAVCEHCAGGLHLRLRADVWDGVLAGHARARFTLAHEIGHLVLHRQDLAYHQGRAFRDTVTPAQKLAPGVPVFASPEWQANAWAGAYLMPFEAVRTYLQRLGEAGDELSHEAFAANFQVSVAAASIRLEKLLPRLLANTV